MVLSFVPDEEQRLWRTVMRRTPIYSLNTHLGAKQELNPVCRRLLKMILTELGLLECVAQLLLGGNDIA